MLPGIELAEWWDSRLWTRSLDQSNLLVAMLHGNGVPARYRHGTLSTERARELILSMFSTTGAVVGDVPEDTETSDPANDPDLLAGAQDHWRLGDNETIVIGDPFWELLSNYPFGQFAVTSEYLHFDVQDAGGNTTRYTRQIADRVKAGPRTGPLRQPRMVRGLMTRDVLSSLGPEALPLVHEADSHTIYVNPSWMSNEYAAHVGEDLLVTVPRIAEVESVAAGLGVLDEGYEANSGAVELAEMADLVDGTIQAFDRMLGASFVTMSDQASQDLAETGLVRTYPDAPRITIASSVISMSKEISQTAQLQALDLLHDSVRAIGYPGQARGAEKVYRMTRGVCNTFLESAVGEALTGELSKSAANVLQAALDQDIPLAYVDADYLDVLARLEISTQAKAFITDAVQQGYGVIVPEQMVAWDGSSGWSRRGLARLAKSAPALRSRRARGN